MKVDTTGPDSHDILEFEPSTTIAVPETQIAETLIQEMQTH